MINCAHGDFLNRITFLSLTLALTLLPNRMQQIKFTPFPGLKITKILFLFLPLFTFLIFFIILSSSSQYVWLTRTKTFVALNDSMSKVYRMTHELINVAQQKSGLYTRACCPAKTAPSIKNCKIAWMGNINCVCAPFFFQANFAYFHENDFQWIHNHLIFNEESI